MIIMLGGDLSVAELWGFIPSFLDENDPRGAREQFNAKYQGGWNPFDGFTFDSKAATLTYPGDPPMKARSLMYFRDEIIVLFDHAWVLVGQKDKTWEVSRMD